jgi:hypothetical protein
LVKERLDLGFVGDVGGNDDDYTILSAQFCCCLIERRLIAGSNDQLRPLSTEGPRQALTDAGSGSGDDRDFIL